MSRHHRLLRRRASTPRRPVVGAGISRCAVGQDRGAANDARPASLGHAGIDRCVDQVVPPDENTPNTAISYTRKAGSSIPARREDTARHRQRAQSRRGDARSVCPLLRRPRFHPRRVSCDRRAHRRHRPRAFWRTAIEGTDELDYREALAVFELQFKPADGFRQQPKAWIGAATRTDAGRVLVSQVKRGTPAFSAASTGTMRSSRSKTWCACRPVR